MRADAELSRLLSVQEGVVTRAQALRFMTPKALQHGVESGRWRAVHRGVYVVHNGQLSRSQREWAAVLAAGPGGRAMLGGPSALARFGVRGYEAPAVHVLIPARFRDLDPPRGVVVHRTRFLPGHHVHTMGRPPAIMPGRSVVDAA